MMNKSSLEAAAEAAAKVNAMLIAKGKLKLPPSQLKPKINSSGRGLSGDLITAEVDINDAPISARNLLTRGHTQDEICKYSGAAISTRGRYMTLEERQNISTSDCRPLYLHIQASSKESVGLAVKRIKDIINQHVMASGGVKSPTVGVVTYPTSNLNGTNNSMMSINTPPLATGPHFVQDKVFVGLEQAPPTYPVREKILGPNGSFLQHIRTETGANVTLRGKGSGFIEPTSGREAFEPLYIHVTHPKVEGLQAAKALAINLVETAHVEFAQWQQQQQRSVMQPITPIVIPQATPVAYQNQVVVTPAVVPVSVSAIVSSPSIVTGAIPLPSSSVAGISLPQTVSQLVQAPVSGVPPVSIVTSIPVSVQGVSSQAVISYPTTYVANHTSAVARVAGPVAAPTVSSIVGVIPRHAVSTAYTIATSQATSFSVSQYPTSVQAVALSSPLTYAAVPSTQAVLQQPSVVVAAQSPASFSTMPQTYVSNQTAVAPVAPMSVVQGVGTAYPHIQYSAAIPAETVKQQHYYKPNHDMNRNEIPDSRHSLQESNSNHPTENGSQKLLPQPQQHPASGLAPSGSQDHELMPPPLKPVVKENATKRGLSKSSESDEPDKKKLRGALIGLASVYGSDDSSDDESPSSADSSHSKSYGSSRNKSPMM